MFEAIDTFGDFEVYPAVVDVLHKVVFVDELLRYVFDADTRVFGSVQRCSQVVVGDIGTEEFGAWSRADAVEYSFDYFDCPCFGAAVTSVCDGVATDGDAGSVGVFLANLHVTYNTNVGDVLVSVLRDLVKHDWAHGVGSFDSLRKWRGRCRLDGSNALA